MVINLKQVHLEARLFAIYQYYVTRTKFLNSNPVRACLRTESNMGVAGLGEEGPERAIQGSFSVFAVGQHLRIKNRCRMV